MSAQNSSSLIGAQTVPQTTVSNRKVLKINKPHNRILIATQDICCLMITFTFPARQNTDQDLPQVTGLKTSLS